MNRLGRRTAALVLATVWGAIGGACKEDDRPKAVDTRIVGRPIVPAAPPAASSLSTWAETHAASGRVRPDARFVLAFEHLELLLQKPGSGHLTATPTGDASWSLGRSGEPPVAALPAELDFSAGLEQLRRYVNQLGAKAGAGPPVKPHPKTPRSPAGRWVVGRAALDRLTALGTGPGEPSAAALREAARTLAVVSFQMTDDTGLGDPVFARALAVLAWAEVASGTTVDDARALLAFSMGYRSAAGGPGNDFHYVIDALRPHLHSHRFVLFDQRGSLLSRVKAGETKAVTLEAMVEDLELLRVALGARQLMLFGHSWGTLLGLAYFQKFPDNVAGLVLSGTLPPYLPDGLAGLVKEMRPRQALLRERPSEIAKTLRDAGLPVNPEADTARQRSVRRRITTLAPITIVNLSLWRQVTGGGVYYN